VNGSVNDEAVRQPFTGSPDTALNDGDSVTILPASPAAVADPGSLRESVLVRGVTPKPHHPPSLLLPPPCPPRCGWLRPSAPFWPISRSQSDRLPQGLAPLLRLSPPPPEADCRLSAGLHEFSRPTSWSTPVIVRCPLFRPLLATAWCSCILRPIDLNPPGFPAFFLYSFGRADSAPSPAAGGANQLWRSREAAWPEQYPDWVMRYQYVQPGNAQAPPTARAGALRRVAARHARGCGGRATSRERGWGGGGGGGGCGGWGLRWACRCPPRTTRPADWARRPAATCARRFPTCRSSRREPRYGTVYTAQQSDRD